MSDTLTLDALVEEVARAIAARRGWNWDLMPSFKDRFTRGCSHEECRDAARAAPAAVAKRAFVDGADEARVQAASARPAQTRTAKARPARVSRYLGPR